MSFQFDVFLFVCLSEFIFEKNKWAFDYFLEKRILNNRSVY